MNDTFVRQFWSRVAIKGRNECWHWTGAKSSRGYGTTHVRTPDGRRRTVSTHRLAWEISHRKSIPAGKLIMHTCDNPICVNPKHLRLGTSTDNNRDTVSKRRGFVGQLNGRSKLTSNQVTEIKDLYQTGLHSMKTLGKKFGVSNVMICNIINGKNWKHIDGGVS